MLCDVCKSGIEGIWVPGHSKRLAKRDELEEQWESFDREPKAGWGKFWSSLLEGREDLEDLEPFECVFAHHKNEASFVASLRDGCALCNRYAEDTSFSQGWPKAQQKESDGNFSIFCINWVHSRLAVRISTGRYHSETWCGFLEDVKPDRNMNYEYETSNDSPRTWSIIDDWMKTCTESHQECRQPDLSASYRPTRLLKMSDKDSFRLVQGSDCPPSMQYAALSYCWGPKPAHSLLRLLRSSLSNFSDWQPVDGLPKTFRDAMHIAQRLGAKYLWIDRLCIFQDSAEDWQKEASTMQDVYRNAYVGIAALSAEDDEGGCIFERDPAKVGPTLLSLKIERSGRTRNFKCQSENFWSWRHTFENEPLCQRSWVVQERLLAPRTLHFGSKQVFWECREATCCEMHPEGMDPSGHIIPKNEVLRVQGHRHLWKRLLAAEIVENSGIRSQLFLDWDMVVNVYADRQLSVPSDKLVALSGLANDMKKRLEELQPGPHRYLAGLWEDELMCQLSWCVIGSAKRVRLYRAPSWSWACLDGRVVPGLRSTELNEPVDLASLISADMVYVGKEETGEVKSGTLTLEGPYMWAKLGPPGPGIFASATSGVTSYEPMSKSVDADVWFDSLDDTAEEALLFWTWHSKHGIKGVALAMVENGFYRRLGVAGCHMWPRENMKAFLETLPRTEIRII